MKEITMRSKFIKKNNKKNNFSEKARRNSFEERITS